MELHTQPHFDLSRLRDPQSFNNLVTPSDRMKFFFAVKEYFDFLRSDPWLRDDWDEEEQQEAAQSFLKMINNEIGWPHARQAVPEFQRPLGDLEKLRDPVRYIMRSVQHRLTPPRQEISTAQQQEEEMIRRQVFAHSQWIGYVNGQVEYASEDVRSQVEDATSDMTRALDTMKGIVQEHTGASRSVGEVQDLRSGSMDEGLILQPAANANQRVPRTDQRPRQKVNRLVH